MENITFEYYLERLACFTELVQSIPTIEDISIEARNAYQSRLKKMPWFSYFWNTPIRNYNYDSFKEYCSKDNSNL